MAVSLLKQKRKQTERPKRTHRERKPERLEQAKGPRREPKPLSEILVEDSTYARIHLKRRLIEEKILPYICALCDQEPEWQGQKLVLVLDHINGINNDNRRENLRFLCPNCNSQTSTFSGRNRHPAPAHVCLDCPAEIYRSSLRCRSCAAACRRGRTHPTADEIRQARARNTPWRELGHRYGVSGNAVRKRAKKYGLLVSSQKRLTTATGSSTTR